MIEYLKQGIKILKNIIVSRGRPSIKNPEKMKNEIIEEQTKSIGLWLVFIL